MNVKLNATEVKLAKEKDRLQVLNGQKAELEEKIKKSEAEIKRLQGILNQKKFNEANDVLCSAGLSLEDVLKAVKNGDMLSLQERMEEAERKNTTDDTEEDTL